MRRLVVIIFVASVAVLASAPEVVAEQDSSFKQVVDNETEGRFEADDGWGTSSYGRGVKENNYRFARPAEGASDARFRVEIQEAGNYTVYARWPDVKGGNNAAQVGVETASGTQWTQVDQQRDGGRWVPLGIFEMQAGDDNSVVFSRQAGGDGYVIADAVKVEYDSPAAATPEPPESEKAAPPEPSESEENRVSESSAPEGRSGQDVVREARKWIGVRYKLGGQTRRGVDCSGLTMMVFKRFGVSLPHWDDKQFRMGKKVAKGQEKPGDLVFFNEHGRGISHVGIYSGNGNIVHASDYFGEVTESKMKYIKGYAGARRLPTDGRAADRSADEQSEGQDESESAPETEASPPAEVPTSTDRVSPSSGGAPREVATEQPTQAENPELQAQEAQPASQSRPKEAQKKATPSKAKTPSKSNEREDQKSRVSGVN